MKNNFTTILNQFKKLPKEQKGDAFSKIVDLEIENRKYLLEEQKLKHAQKIEEFKMEVEIQKIDLQKESKEKTNTLNLLD